MEERNDEEEIQSLYSTELDFIDATLVNLINWSSELILQCRRRWMRCCICAGILILPSNCVAISIASYLTRLLGFCVRLPFFAFLFDSVNLDSTRRLYSISDSPIFFHVSHLPLQLGPQSQVLLFMGTSGVLHASNARSRLVDRVEAHLQVPRIWRAELPLLGLSSLRRRRLAKISHTQRRTRLHFR